MGLFSTSLSIYKKNQADVVDALKGELKATWKLSNFDRIVVDSNNFQDKLDTDIYSKSGVFYLVSERSNDWTTILELNVKLNKPFYLYDIGCGMSLRLRTYALSFHLHDDDVLFYNLDCNGERADGYNSDVQYFETERLDRNEIINQRHDGLKFSELLPPGKTVDGLLEILNRGYWKAFDNNDLNKDGNPDDEKYDDDEEERLKEIGRYIEVYDSVDFPYANWYEDIYKLDLSKCYLLRADR